MFIRAIKMFICNILTLPVLSEYGFNNVLQTSLFSISTTESVAGGDIILCVFFFWSTLMKTTLDNNCMLCLHTIFHNFSFKSSISSHFFILYLVTHKFYGYTQTLHIWTNKYCHLIFFGGISTQTYKNKTSAFSQTVIEFSFF